MHFLVLSQQSVDHLLSLRRLCLGSAWTDHCNRESADKQMSLRVIKRPGESQNILGTVVRFWCMSPRQSEDQSSFLPVMCPRSDVSLCPQTLGPRHVADGMCVWGCGVGEKDEGHRLLRYCGISSRQNEWRDQTFFFELKPL